MVEVAPWVQLPAAAAHAKQLKSQQLVTGRNIFIHINTAKVQSAYVIESFSFFLYNTLKDLWLLKVDSRLSGCFALVSRFKVLHNFLPDLSAVFLGLHDALSCNIKIGNMNLYTWHKVSPLKNKLKFVIMRKCPFLFFNIM